LRSTVNDNQAANLRFTGKELDKESHIGLYYFGARYYDPEVGRFIGVDPLADKYPSWSPYHYTLNNPLRYLDPDGKDIIESERALNSDRYLQAKTLFMKSALGRRIWEFIASESSILVGIDVDKLAENMGGITKWSNLAEEEYRRSTFLWGAGRVTKLKENEYKYQISLRLNTEKIVKQNKNEYTQLRIEELALVLFHELDAHIYFRFLEWHNNQSNFDPANITREQADREHQYLGNTNVYDTHPSRDYRQFGIEAFGSNWWDEYDPSIR
jgi:RHS repeat-associated protein